MVAVVILHELITPRCAVQYVNNLRPFERNFFHKSKNLNNHISFRITREISHRIMYIMFNKQHLMSNYSNLLNV